eukprot:TRINITY_DN450_c0_g1_i1.p1 TRINITY_DN450_c0_g1~~TRINITY_DN450_c0_g1_i1.p1  ORF type:complete len:810 (+),score=225.15 TRINITY_DN450_c0_g1_i1:228-2657(+)
MRQSYVQEVVNIIKNTQKVRNISVIAHVDHGKTTLVDSLLAKAGIIKQENAGKLCVMDTTKEEQERGITIKSTGISLIFNHKDENYVINLVDSPGHVDFSSEVTAALRITDGALIVVDCVEGVCVQTETVTRQALAERIKPVLHINKVDRAITELGLSAEELYQKLTQVIQSVNVVLSQFKIEGSEEVNVDPLRGDISFGSGKQGWAFTLPQYAEMIAQKTGKKVSSIINRMWGNHFYDSETQRFYDQPVSPTGKPLERYVCQVLLKPLIKIYQTIIQGNKEELDKMLPSIGVKLTKEDREITKTSDLISRVLQQWLPAGDALAKMIIDFLPSPVEAQKYRAETLYTGPADDECAVAMKNCDPNGPVMMFVSKMVPSSDGKRFYAFGRIFSGTLRAQTEVRVMGPDYEPGKTVPTKRIPRIVMMMGKTIENVDEVPCGNTVGVLGLDSVLIKSGTISTSPVAHSIAPMKFSVSPVVRCAVAPSNTAHLPRFIQEIRRLENIDPCLQVIISESGECIIGAAGALHLEVALKELKTMLGDIKITTSNPIVPLIETVQATSTDYIAKSPNGHNRLSVMCEPLSPGLVEELEKSSINQKDQVKLIQILVKHGWTAQDAKKVWFVKGSNLVVDMSRGVQFLHEIKDSVRASFEWVCEAGVLCEEPLRGVRFNITDATLHADAIHRGGGQIIPTARHAFLATQLAAKPCLVEPVFLAEISTEQEMISKIYSVLSQRRGYVIDESAVASSPIFVVKAHLPVLESFGVDSVLREATSGRAFPQMMFSHWQLMEPDQSDKAIKDVRKRKMLKEDIPLL